MGRARLALPGGRLQALGIAWDARPRAEGGQRWYALYPEDPPAPGEALHWSGRDQNANFMCLGCHATGYRKGYDEATDVYRSTQAELAVGCEACHGPGSAHRAWVRAGRPPDAGKGFSAAQSRLRRRVFAFLPGTPIARAQGPAPDGHAAFVHASRLVEDADATAVAQAIRSEDALVRLGAARGLSRLPARAAVALGRPLLDDERRAVRIEAARALAGLPWPAGDGSGPQALQRATAELLQAERQAAERPQAQLKLAALHARLGQSAQAEAALRRALWLDPGFVPAQINLAEWLRQQGRDAEAEPLLRQAVALSPRDGVPAHALGLWLIRRARLSEALPWLRQGWTATPSASHARAYGLVLAESGQAPAGLQVLAQACERWPADTALLRNLITVEQRLGLHDAARRHARSLQGLTSP